MMHDLSFVERHHRAVCRESAPVSLIPKRCACGKACSAKQLVQYGCCVACVRANKAAT